MRLTQNQLIMAKYKRILLKLSGESLMGKQHFGIDPERLGDLPGEDLSQPMRQAWHHLTASLRALPKDGLRQQGLLQIHADFCSNPSLTCATCPLATGT